MWKFCEVLLGEVQVQPFRRILLRFSMWFSATAVNQLLQNNPKATPQMLVTGSVTLALSTKQQLHHDPKIGNDRRICCAFK